MSDSFLDHLPSHEQKRLKRMMSAAAYEQLREKVKGPEDLKEELKRGEQMAELHFALASDPEFHEHLHAGVREHLMNGVEKILEKGKTVPPETKKALEHGKFTVTVGPHPTTHHDTLLVLPEGTVQEAVPLKPSEAQSIAQQVLQHRTV